MFLSKIELLRSSFLDLLPITYYLLSITHDLLPTTYYLSPVTYHLLLTAYYLRQNIEKPKGNIVSSSRGIGSRSF